MTRAALRPSILVAAVPGVNRARGVRIRHTRVDVYERVPGQDLTGNALVMAWFARRAANTAERVARP